MKQLILLVVVTVLSACGEVEKEEDIAVENMSAVAADYALAYENASPLQLFFKEDQTRAIFREEGNTDISYIEETYWLSESYVKTLVEKDHKTWNSIYRITENTVEIIYEGVAELDATVAELEKMPAKGIFLSLPLEVGTSFEGWLITDVDLKIETPFETFDQIMVLTKENGGEEIRRFFAPGFGLVKETSTVEKEELSIETTSLLHHLEYR